MSSRSIVVIAEHAEGQVRPVTYELAAFARTLQTEIQSSDIKIIVIGDAIDRMAEIITRKTGLSVFALYVPGLAVRLGAACITCVEAIVKQGWLDYAQQIGVTGCTVVPNLYIACGISGAIQHVSGMRESGFIVAINTDSKAAIFNVSDVCIVEDLTTFIPILIETHEKRCADETSA